jgi:ADP-ribosylglycohydrolase
LEKGQSPTKSGERGGAGNGVVMKLAPLALWHFAKQTPKPQRDRELNALTKMTHDSSEAVVASAVHSEVLQFLLSVDGDDFDGTQFLHRVTAIAERYETQYRTSPTLSQKLNCLASAGAKTGVDTDTIHSVASGGGFYVPETLAMVYGNFTRMNTFPESVFSVIGLGGDTDSTSSITATMSLLLHGTFEAPEDFEQTFDYARLHRISTDLARCALRS